VSKHAHQTSPGPVVCFVLTVSDTRTAATDASGDAIVSLLEAAGHRLSGRALLPDDPVAVAARVAAELKNDWPGAIITTGGTGISRRDSTYEAITGLLEKRLDGFGELFRMLSFQEIGPAAMLSRATAGIAGSRAIFVLPGSEHAVRLAMTRLILPELRHVIAEAIK
jgi:molybdenum cofactor biosynthesis protein B